MEKKKLIAASLIVFLHQVVWAQSAELIPRGAPLWGDQQADGVRALPICFLLRGMNSPPGEPNWARVSDPENERTGIYVETTSIVHCNESDRLMAIYWEKHILSDGSYLISKFRYDCTRRRGGSSEISWLYAEDGAVSDWGPKSSIGNDIPISRSYDLMHYICDSERDSFINYIPNSEQNWIDINVDYGDVTWSVLINDIVVNYPDYYGGNLSFWVRKDYSRANWTSYRLSYSFDSIDCEAASYTAGRAIAFLPNAINGEETYEFSMNRDSMRNIAPGSIQAAVMEAVCNRQ